MRYRVEELWKSLFGARIRESARVCQVMLVFWPGAVHESLACGPHRI
jgi:hypothetical protein